MTATVRIPRWNVLAVTAATGHVWAAAAWGLERGRVLAVDERNARVVRSIRLAGGVAPRHVAAAGGWVWAATAGTLVRIDPATGRVGPTLAAGSAEALLAGFGSIWMADGGERTLLRLDPRSGRVVARVPLGGPPGELAIGEGSVWVGLFDRGTVVRVDPRTNRRVGVPIRVPGREHRIDGLTVAGGAVWVGNAYGQVFRLDPRSGRLLGRVIPLP